MNTNGLNVLKFGGTSVKDAETIDKVFNIVSNNTGKQAIVVSAHAGVTNMLVDICNSKKEAISPILSELFKKHFTIANELGIIDKVKEFIKNELSEID
ncbi:MAG: hypothetical protein RIF34_01580, partial [Candidatus Kapaibacterium sp.]